jgi:multisubunit Na+/H+ antiporter MnhB subunit
MKSLMNKKGQSLGEAPNLILLLVIVGIVAAIGLLVVGNVGDSFTAGTAEANATDKAIESITNFTNLMPVLGTVFIAVIVLGAVAFLAVTRFMNR